MFTIKSQIVLAYTLIFGVILSVFAYIIYHSTEKAEIARLDSKLKSYSVLLQSEIEEQSREHDGYDLSDFEAVPSDGLKWNQFELLDRNGKNVLGDTIITQPGKSFCDSIFNLGEKYDKLKIGRHHARVYISTVEINEKTNHILIVSSSLEEVREDLERLLLIFFIVIPSGLIFAGFSAYLIAKRAFSPISKMILTADNISAYSLEKRLLVRDSNDEVKALSLTLNSMLDRIDSSFKSHRQFIANASHEIKTPLTVIQTELELSLNKIKDEETAEGLRISLSEIENLDRLTSSLLTLAKIDAQKNNIEVSIVRIDELVLECVQVLTPFAEKAGKVINITIDEIFEIEGDKDKLKSIVMNLLENALKYSVDSKVISIELAKSVTGIDLYVKDSGPGIPANELPNIFERFYRSNETRAEIGGSGLGLAIVKEFVDMHKGIISVSSKPGETIFRVQLPLTQKTS